MPQGASNPNDFKVVTFTNKTDFEFTPELGCMYDSRPIFGKSGAPIQPGESVVLPYHIGNLLAENLAKAVLVRGAGVDQPGIPTGVSMWSEESLRRIQSSYLTNMYTEDKPAQMSETDKLMAKVEEYAKLVEKLIPASELNKQEGEKTGDDNSTQTPAGTPATDFVPTVYKDKADVIAELQKRQITFDARKSKADLEKLLVN